MEQPRGASGNRIKETEPDWTPRVVRVLRQVAKFGYLTYEEIAALNGTGALKTWQNLCREMVNDGHLVGYAVGPWRWVAASEASLRREGIHGLQEREPRMMTFFHHAGVVRLGLFFARAAVAPGQEHYYLTETEIWGLNRVGRAELLEEAVADWGDDAPHPSSWEEFIVEGADGYTRNSNGTITGGYLMPDAVLLRRGHRPVAIEVETTLKEWSRYVAKFTDLSGVDGRNKYAGVQYFCSSEDIAKNVRMAAAEVGAGDFIHARLFPSDDVMPLPVLMMERITGRKLSGTPGTDGTLDRIPYVTRVKMLDAARRAGEVTGG